MKEILTYLIGNDDAFFYLEFLFVNGKLYARDIDKNFIRIFTKFVDDELVYEKFIKRGLHITKYYTISTTGADYYMIAQAIRESTKVEEEK